MLVAGFIRGYTGFGGPAVVVIALTYFFAPISIVSKVLVIDTVANLHLVRSTAREANWRQNLVLIGATLIGTPVGVWALTMLDDVLMQQVIAVLSLACAAILLTGWRFKQSPGNPLLFAVGLAAGVSTAATGIALLMMAFLFMLPGSAAVSRANAVQWLLVISLLVVGQYFFAGLLTLDDMGRAALLGLVYLGGTLLGSALFRASNDATVRRAAVWLVFTLALMGLTKSFYE
jgi:hypothetical protein